MGACGLTNEASRAGRRLTPPCRHRTDKCNATDGAQQRVCIDIGGATVLWLGRALADVFVTPAVQARLLISASGNGRARGPIQAAPLWRSVRTRVSPCCTCEFHRPEVGRSTFCWHLLQADISPAQASQVGTNLDKLLYQRFAAAPARIRTDCTCEPYSSRPKISARSCRPSQHAVTGQSTLRQAAAGLDCVSPDQIKF